MGPRKHVLDGVQIPMLRDNFSGKKTCPACPTTLSHELLFRVVSLGGLKEPCVTWVPGLPCEWAIFRGQSMPGMTEDILL